MPYLHQAQWQEVHLLVLGRLGSSAKEAEQARNLINTLVDVYPKPPRLLRR
jgi:hypothetical protein